MKPQVDIVVVSYNEAERIPIILESLYQQTAPLDSFKVIFVDNNSQDNTKEVVESHKGDLDLVYVLETKQASNHARNAGVQHATSDYIAFTDADIKLDKNWVRKIQEIIIEQSPHVFGGPYYPYYKEEAPKWYRDEYNSRNRGDTARYLNLSKEDISAANMIWRRETLLSQGRFNPSSGVIGRSLARGAETELLQRCIKHVPDFGIYYDPQLIVYHYTRPITYSLWYWCKRKWATGVADIHVFQDLPQQKQSIPQLLFEIIKLIWSIVAGLAYALIKRDKEQFPYVENYLYEKTFSYVRFIGRNYGAIRQRLSKSHES